MAPKNIPYITTLTPLRGIAALLVVIFHSNLMLETFLPPGITGIVGQGWLWVDFFFILSGFIMLYVYGNSFEKAVNKSNFTKYFWARFARVYPLNLITLAVALILAIYIRSIADGLDPFFQAMLDPWAAPASLVFLQGMHLFDAAPLNTPSWSLSTEWWMYMIFPFLVPFFSTLKRNGIALILLVLVFAYLALIYLIGPISGPFGGSNTLNLVADFGFLRCMVGFVLGMWIHQLFKGNTGKSFFEKDFVFIFSFVAILVCMHFQVHEMITLIFFCTTILSATYNHGEIKKFLDTKPLQRLGDWSFSIYMTHVLIIYVFWIVEIREDPKYFADIRALFTKAPDYTQGLISLLILVTTTMIISWLTYKFVEIPSREYLKKKLVNKKSIEEIETKIIIS